RRSAMKRAGMSVGPPAVNPTTMRIVRVGKSCAEAGTDTAMRAPPASRQQAAFTALDIIRGMTRTPRMDLPHGGYEGAGADGIAVCQSALVPANLTTLAHFSVSPAMSAANSAGEPGSSVPPCSDSRSIVLASARPALISRLSVSMIAAGVPLGTPTPNQVLAS